MEKNSKFTFTEVPFTAVEWQRAQYLYKSYDLLELQELLNIVKVWTSRMDKDTPVFITCTELIVRLSIEELHLKENPSVDKRENLKLLHGIGCIRIVNFLNELGQTEQGLLNMQNSVKKLGIPPWVVDVRHGVAHGHIPPLETLRKFHNFAREWLWDYVWQKPLDVSVLRAGMPASVLEEQTAKAAADKELRMVDILRKFVQWRITRETMMYQPEEIKRINELKPLVKIIEKEPYDFLRCFVKDDMLILSPEQISDSNCNEDNAATVMQKFWSPIICLIMTYGLASDLMVSIITRLHDRSLVESSRKQLVSWTQLFLSNYAEEDSIQTFTTQEWGRILRAIVAVPLCFNSTQVNKVMNKIPNMSRKRRRQVTKIMDITMRENLNTSEDDPNDKTGDVKTVADLQRMIKKDISNKVSSNWQLCDEDEWIGVPLGLTPWQTYESISHYIDEEVAAKYRSGETANANMDSSYYSSFSTSNLTLVDDMNSSSATIVTIQ